MKAIASNNQIHMSAITFKRLEPLYLLPNVVWAHSDFQNVCVQVSRPGTGIPSHRFQRLILPLYLIVPLGSPGPKIDSAWVERTVPLQHQSEGPVQSQDRRMGANSEGGLFYTLRTGSWHPENVGESRGGDTMTHSSTSHTIKFHHMKNWSWRPC